jgi:hypothetical protein
MRPTEVGWERVGQGLPLTIISNYIKLYIMLLLLLSYGKQKWK